MIIRETDPGPARVISLQGDLNQEAAVQVRHRFDQVLRRAGRKARLVVDLAGVEYISAGGLKTILHLLREINRLDGRMVVCGLKEYPAEVFEATQVAALVSIRPDIPSALEEF